MKSVDLALMTATIACAFMVGICYDDGKNENIVITAVTRRINHDLYFIHNVGHDRCEDDYTFMVEEKNCSKNEDLFNEDYDGEHEYKRPGLYIMQDPNSELILYDELKKGHICHIASLEVVRGENKSYEIDHSGFSLVNGTLSVHEGMLAYSLTEYAGELYRIKLSCAGDEKIYFFIVWGRANVTESKFNCTVCGTLYKYCPAPLTIVTTTTTDSGTTTDGQEPIKISVINIVGGGAGSFSLLVLVLGLLCTCAVICKKRRVKVSAIRSRILERNGLTMNRGSDTKNEKGTDVDNDQCIYAIPGELVQSNVYGCGGLASNPAYKERSASYSRSGEHIEFDDSAIPRHLNPCYEHSNIIEEPVYQEIIPRHPTMSISSSRIETRLYTSQWNYSTDSTSIHGST